MAITPASIRNRNPGAMYPGWAAKKFGSTSHEVLRSKDGTHKIATFPTSIHGAAAQFCLLASKNYTGRTVRAAITKWCGGYSAGVYLGVLEKRAGVTADTILTAEMIHDPQFSIPLAKAMALQEAGRQYPMTLDEWKAAHQMAFAGEVAPAWTPDNDVPSRKAEDRRDDKIKTTVETTAVGGAVVTGGKLAEHLSPPDLSPITAWQGLAQSVVSLADWAASNVMLVGAAIAAAGAVWLWRSR